MKITRRLWIGLIVLALLTPLGIVLPEWLGAGDAWGEWSAEELGKLVGYVPAKLGRLAELWRAPLPDYGGPGGAEGSLMAQSGWYVISALVGLGAVVGLAFLVGRWLAKNERGAAEMDD